MIIQHRINQILQKIDKQFEGLSFIEETHKYHYKGKELPSVSSFLNSLSEKVDFDKIAHAISKRDGIPYEQIKNDWKRENDISIVKGKKTHSFAELDVISNPETKEEEAILKFWKELPIHYHIVKKELQMVHINKMYCGTCDLLLYNELTDKLVLVDYKTNKDLFKNFRGKTLLPPFEFLLECPYNKYQVQLQMYQFLIEQIDEEVEEKWVVWTKEDSEKEANGNYSLMKTQDFSKEIKLYLNVN